MHSLQAHRIRIERTARYFSTERPQPCREIVLALHGYGQSAELFAGEVTSALLADQWLVAPEGLSRFYQRGVYGNVVASWMTKEDRESEIEDQYGYLDRLLAQLRRDCPEAVLTVLAFSQGVATACRWLARWPGRVDRLLLWAGTPPEDVWMQVLAQKLSRPALVMVGDQDEYISEEALHQVLARLDGLAFPYELHRFSGTHQLDPDLLRSLLAQDHSGDG